MNNLNVSYFKNLGIECWKFLHCIQINYLSHAGPPSELEGSEIQIDGRIIFGAAVIFAVLVAVICIVSTVALILRLRKRNTKYRSAEVSSDLDTDEATEAILSSSTGGDYYYPSLTEKEKKTLLKAQANESMEILVKVGPPLRCSSDQ